MKLKMFFLFMFLILVPSVFAKGIESMTYTAGYSRGMMMFYICLVLLIAFPLVNKELKSLFLIGFVIVLGRGLIRIGEQDIVKSFFSIPYGMKIGVPVVLAVLAVSAVLFIPMYILRKANIIKPEMDDSLENYFKEGTKRGHDIESLKKALYLQGINKSDVDSAADSVTSSNIFKKIGGVVKKDSSSELNDYFEKGLKKGYSLNSLKKALVNKGADPDVVERVSKKFEGKPDYLVNYLKNGMRKGFSADLLKSALIKQGISSKEIEEAFKVLRK